MRNVFAGVCLYLALSIMALSAEAKEPIGTIRAVEGIAYVQRGFERILCRPGLELFEEDLIRTRSDGKVGVTLADGTSMALASNTLVQINSFLFDENGGSGELDASVERGKLVIRTGRISDLSKSDIKIRTDQSIMGVRGTFFAISS